MKRLLLAAAVLGLAVAKPGGTYKETEDFKYSRSSSDDGTKSGYYGAQRGNMGGNYERAHNMDSLAQNQMNSLVSQTDGDLGDGSKMKAGNVFTSANSQGVYGSGRRYDFSHLGGRNFEDGNRQSSNFGSNSQSSLNSAYTGQSSSASHNSGYSSSQAQNSRRHQSSDSASQLSQSSNLETADNTQGQYDYGRRQNGYSSGYQSQSRYQGSHTNGNQYYTNAGGPTIRLVSGAPAKVVIRPAGTVIVPVSAQSYDSTHGSTSYDQNAINSEAEVLTNNNQQTSNLPSNNAKHYHSSSSYRKQWEKHESFPVGVPQVIPTASTYPQNSELYDDSRVQEHGYNSNNARTAASNNRYNFNSQSSQKSQSQYRTDYNSQQQNLEHSSASDANTQANSYNYGAAVDGTNYASNVNSKPKSYQSSYSYHKSWERQGEPYEIKLPGASSISDGQTSQRLTADSAKTGYSSHQYGSQYRQRYGHACTIECEPNGHLRVARSYNTAQIPKDDVYQNQYEGQETQQVQSGWAQLEDLGQQTQNTWNDYSDQGQQAQTNWNHEGFEKLEDLGQQTQDKWDNLGQQTQTQWDNLEHTGQQTQDKWDNLEQQSQSQWNRLEDGGQQTENRWEKAEDLGQQIQTDLGQQAQSTWDAQESAGSPEKINNSRQDSQKSWDEIEDLGQQIQTTWNNNKSTSVDQFSETSLKESEDTPYSHHGMPIWNQVSGFESFNKENQNTQNVDKVDSTQMNYGNHNFEQTNNWDQIPQTPEDEFGQNTQNLWGELDTVNKNNDSNTQVKPVWEQSDTNIYQIHDNDSRHWNNNNGTFRSYFNQESHQTVNHINNEAQSNSHLNHNVQSATVSSLQSFWDKINKFDQVSLSGNDYQTDYSNYSLHNTSSNNSYHHWIQTEQTENNDSKNFGYRPQDRNPETPSSTLKPKENTEKTNPLDIGRGDIGPEDLDLSEGPPTTGKPSYVTDKDNSQFSPISEKNKTPEEIESLSLLKINKSITSFDNNYESHEFKESRNNEKSENAFNVLSLNDQKLLENQQQHTTSRTIPIYNTNKYSTINQIPLDVNTNNKNKIQNNNTYNNIENKSTENRAVYHSNTDHISQGSENFNIEQIQSFGNEEEQSETSGQHSQTRLELHNNLNQHSQSSWDRDLVDLGEKTQTAWEPKTGLQKQTDVQQFEQFEQTNQGNYQTQDFYQQRYNNKEQQLNQNIETLPETSTKVENFNIEQFESLDNFAEQSETSHQRSEIGLQQDNSFNQQSQSSWDQDLVDLGQETQKAWEPNPNSEQQQEAVVQQFERTNQGNYQTQEIQNQNHHNKEQLPKQNTETLYETSNTVDRLEAVPVNNDVEIIIPPEPTTDKPGFWKSVGNKFSSAKDTVSSWFRKS